MSAGVRSFLAIELTEVVRERLLAGRDIVTVAAPSWRDEKWVRAANLHVTVKFLGNLSEALLADIRAGLGAELAGLPSFDLDLIGARAVPGARRCSMLWATIGDKSGGYERLTEFVETLAGALGVPPGKRPSRPHVTLVRARRPRHIPRQAVEDLHAALACPPLSMSVRSATLFGSTLTRTGPEYRVIDSWVLSNRKSENGTA